MKKKFGVSFFILDFSTFMKKKFGFSRILNRLTQILPKNMPRINKNYLIDIADNHIVHYPSPITLTYA